MSKQVVFHLVGGNLDIGFTAVTAQISVEDASMQFNGSLPPAPVLAERYRRWQLLCRAIYQGMSRFGIDADFEIAEDDVTHISEVDLDQLNQQLKILLNDWLNSASFADIDRQLRTALNPSDEIRLIVETDDDRVQRLPWHLWNFFEDYPKAEMALGCLEQGRICQSQTPGGLVRILAIFGNSEGLDLRIDRALLEALPGVELVVLESPQRQALNEELWEERGWDILFFAGHSKTEGETGRIDINATESLTIAQLKYALKTAIERGLQLAIFNSCDGLGLARSLADLQIPQTIVMREPVADSVAQAFLQYFLTAFAGGQSFYLAVRQAREKLQGLEGEFPGASWLPVICQNPAQVPPIWETLRQGRESVGKRGDFPQFSWKVILLASTIATLFVMGVRSIGWLQIGELQAYDRLMRLRPEEAVDPRLLVVEATEEDIEQYGFPLQDGILAQAIEALEVHQPRTIGLDIYRDRPVGEGKERLSQQFQDNDGLIALCSTRVANNPNKTGIAPPPGVPDSRLSFSEVVKDADGFVRRHLMFMQPRHSSPCITDHAFSSRIALHYLAAEGIDPQTIPPKQVQIGKVILNPLKTRSGAYQQLDDRGFQILLNYRLPQVAQRVRLSQVLSGDINPDWVQDRIVLIGVTSPISADYFYTPYSAAQQPYQTLPGVLLQAQMVSGIVSAVKDGRSLIWWLPTWGDWVWVWCWALVGGSISGCRRTVLWIGLLTGTATGGLYVLCWSIAIAGGWMPLVPSVWALAIAVGSGVVYRRIEPRSGGRSSRRKPLGGGNNF